MSTQLPQIGRLAQIVVDGTIAAYTKSYSVDQSGNVVKEFVLGSDNLAQWPVAAMGNFEGSISMEQLYIDDTYLDLLEAGNVIEIIDYPLGNAAGKPMRTYQCIVSSISQTIDQEAIVQYSLEAEIIAPIVRGTV